MVVDVAVVIMVKGTEAAADVRAVVALIPAKIHKILQYGAQIHSQAECNGLFTCL